MPPPDGSRSPFAQSAKARFNPVLVLATLVGGLLLTALGVFEAQLNDRTEAKARFDQLADRLTGEVQRRMHLPVYGLKSARGLFVASKSVERYEFRDYIASRDIATEFPGVLGFGFIQHVPRSGLAEFIAAERADHAPDFNVHGSGDAPDLYVVKFIYPEAGNREAWGYDTGAIPERRPLIERAIRSGEPTLTHALKLVQSRHQRTGVLYLLPVYRNGSDPVTPEEREAALVGLVYAPLAIDAVFANIMTGADRMLDIEVFDGLERTQENLLLDADDILVGSPSDLEQEAFGNRMFHRITTLKIGGRQWTLVLTSTPQFEASVNHREPFFIGLGGTVISLLLAGMVYSLGRSRSRALDLAREMTASLRTSEAEAQRLAMVASRTNNAVLISDTHGRIEWANDAFTRITGYTLADVQGRKPETFLHGALTDSAAVAEMRAGFGTGRGCKVELIQYTKARAPVWLAVEVQPRLDGNGRLTGFTTLQTDISKRKAAEQKLVANEQRLTALTREVPGVIFQFEVTPDGRRSFPFLSEGYRELFGRDPEAAKRRPALLFATVHRADLPAVQASLEAAIATGTPWIHAFRIQRPDGTLCWIDGRSTAARQPDGTKVWFGALANITALQQARVAAEEAMQRAEQANRAKSQFLAMMSHEIRTPMNGVIGMTSLLLDTALTPQQREFTDIVRSSGESLLTIINDILDFSKIESGRLDLETEPFSIRECVESVLDLLAHRAAQKGIDLLYEIGEGVPAEVRGDITRVRQILVNLAGNAIKFTEQGEVELTVRVAPEGGQELLFAVRDTGIGIPTAAQARLFNSFTQVDASTTRKYGGTGLGLAISKRLAEMMGGRMWFESTPGKGSTFSFTLRPEWVANGSRRFVATERPQLRDKRLLIVDDSAPGRRILATLAERWGMPAVVAASGAEALELLQRGERFDLALLDMQMPGMDGLMLARAIRARPDGDLPLLLLSSIGRHPGTEEPGLFAAVLSKPVKPSQIFDAMARLFGTPAAFAAKTAVPLAPDAGQLQPERLLLAEDNSVNQKVALHMLARLGYRADAVANGQEAIDAVERQHYDIVLMDVQMPEMDGLEATRHIKARPPGRSTPWIIALTANAMEGDRDMCLAAGMDDYLGKPIKGSELASALHRARQALQQRAARAAGS